MGLDKRLGRRYGLGMTDTVAARDFFPRGLIQPEGSFRFSIDALLLAAFAARVARPPTGAGQPPLLLDLGCGCGVAAFGVMLQRPEFTTIGLDKQTRLLVAAAANAARLGFGRQYRTMAADLEAPAGQAELERLFAMRKADLVIANPPYHLPGSGRLPASESRRQALFGGAGNLAAFVRASALAAGDTGAVCLIFPFARAEELIARLADYGLQTARKLPVCSKRGEAPFFCLLAAQKNAGPSSGPDSELILYGGNRTGQGGLTEEALLFCPFLACNPKRIQGPPLGVSPL
ncbi:MAG: methyltransferase domain-containing protein [Deltaproteobacteria bacterium]|jgi:tRNA1(Val) A37 N6-methylase TrmN6|nr:methyltransferase domain-containing protein [Deltaproteobacteria bacterium]